MHGLQHLIKQLLDSVALPYYLPTYAFTTCVTGLLLSTPCDFMIRGDEMMDKIIQMKAATTPFPYYLPDSAEGKGGTPGRDIPSPRRHDMRNWLHDHQQHPTVDGTTPMNKMPQHLDTTHGGQPPPPLLLKKQSLPCRPKTSHHEEDPQGQQQQQQQKQNASDFIAAFLLDAASVTVPTKMSEHDSSYGGKKKSNKKRQQRLIRQNIYGSARSHDSANISRSSSIDSLSECLDVMARGSTKNEANIDDEKIKIETILTKTKQSGRKNKQRCCRLSSTSSRCTGDSDDDLSLVSTFSDWNDMVEKTFGCDDPQGETDDFLFLDLDKHVSEHVGEKKSCCGGVRDPVRNDSRHRVDIHPIRTASASKTSTPTATPITPKPILKVKDSQTMSADTESTNVHDYLEELIAMDNSLRTSCSDSPLKDSIRTTDLDLERFLAGILPEPKGRGNGTEKKHNTKQTRDESKRLSSSTGDIRGMVKDIAERHREQKRLDTSEIARIDRLRERKAAMHTRALHDSVQSKPTATAQILPPKPCPRNKSYDDADRFLRSLEEASSELSKSKISDDKNERREEGMTFSGSSYELVHRSRDGNVKSALDAFDGMLAEIEEGASASQKRQSNQFHPDYNLGMPARSRHDMKEEDPDKAMKGISRLKKLDFAFVRRSNEQWTYSIISDRTDDCIRFVVDEVGRTKRIGRDDWLKNIRRIRVHKHHDHAVGQKQSPSKHPRRRRSTSLPPRKKLDQ